jgi:hypothetical protein
MVHIPSKSKATPVNFHIDRRVPLSTTLSPLTIATPLATPLAVSFRANGRKPEKPPAYLNVAAQKPWKNKPKQHLACTNAKSFLVMSANGGSSN